MGVFALSAVLLIVPAATAQAAVATAAGAAEPGAGKTCDDGQPWYHYHYVTTQYQATPMHSDWANGGQHITVESGQTVESSYSWSNQSGDDFSVGAEIKAIVVGWNHQSSQTMQIAQSKSFTLKSSYGARVPNGKQAREMRWRTRIVLKVEKWKTLAPCNPTKIGSATVRAPFANHAFIWDFQDLDTMKPGCEVRGYPSFGGC
jgi:hypothetical protein